jgi:tetratricopeptide (TPR) repeat protein
VAQVEERYQQGRYAEAVPLAQQALAIRERVLGPVHPKVADSLSGVAVVAMEQGRYAEAESLYQRALTIREQALGPQHPDVGFALNNLAYLYKAQGRLT